MLEKGELAEQVEKLENAKQRLERFYKEKMGMTIDGKSTFGTMAGNSGELISEVSVMARRIEFLEEQAEQRNKQARGDQEPFRKEIARLHEELKQEKAARANIINKKNAEISYFKSELDALLSEIQTSATSNSAHKSNSPFQSD